MIIKVVQRQKANQQKVTGNSKLKKVKVRRTKSRKLGLLKEKER